MKLSFFFFSFKPSKDRYKLLTFVLIYSSSSFCFKPSKDRYKRHSLYMEKTCQPKVSNPQRIATNETRYVPLCRPRSLQVSNPQRIATNNMRTTPSVCELRRSFKPSKDRYKLFTNSIVFGSVNVFRFQTLKGSLQTPSLCVLKSLEYEVSNPQRIATNPTIWHMLMCNFLTFQTLKGSLQTSASPSLYHLHKMFQTLKGSLQTYQTLVHIYPRTRSFKPSKDRYKRQTARGITPRLQEFQTLKGSLQTNIVFSYVF